MLALLFLHYILSHINVYAIHVIANTQDIFILYMLFLIYMHAVEAHAWLESSFSHQTIFSALTAACIQVYSHKCLLIDTCVIISLSSI